MPDKLPLTTGEAAGRLGISESHDQVGTAERGRSAPVAWELARPDDPDVPPLQHRLLRRISKRIHPTRKEAPRWNGS